MLLPTFVLDKVVRPFAIYLVDSSSVSDVSEEGELVLESFIIADVRAS